MDYVAKTCNPSLLGANWIRGKGTAFRVHAGRAVTLVELLLLPRKGSLEHERIALVPEKPHPRDQPCEWHVLVPHAVPGMRYGYRVHGPFDPYHGLRHDAGKVAFDPAGRLIAPGYGYHPSLKSVCDNGQLRYEDSLGYGPLSIIANPWEFDWQGDQPLGLQIAPHKRVYYEAHARGATAKCQLTGNTPGSYAALGSDFFIAHLKRLGVTVLELAITPDIGGGAARASLARMRLA